MIQPPLSELRAEREEVTRQLSTSSSEERLTAQEIDCLLDELGGLEHVLTDATPAEK